jgi:hypothetical protein
MSNYNLGNMTNINYKGNVVKEIKLGSQSIWKQPPIDVSLAHSWRSPMDSYGKLNFNLWKDMRWANSTSTRVYASNSDGHVICVMYAPGGKLGGYPDGLPIQSLQLKWTITNTVGNSTGCWMSGLKSNYFRSQRGKEGNDYSSCGKYANHCMHPQTGWVPFDSRFTGAPGGKSNKTDSSYWFSSFRLHDGNSTNEITIQVHPGNYTFFPNETQDKLYIRTR